MKFLLNIFRKKELPIEVAIIIGHPEGTAAKGEHEFTKPQAEYLKDELTKLKIGSVIFNHPSKGGYSTRLKSIAKTIDEEYKDICVAIELHANKSTSAQSNGHEFQYFEHGNYIARYIADAFKKRFKWSRPRHDNGILQNKTENGSGFLKIMPCPAVLAEPFFLSNSFEHGEFKQDLNIKASAKAYAKGIAKFIKG